MSYILLYKNGYSGIIEYIIQQIGGFNLLVRYRFGETQNYQG